MSNGASRRHTAGMTMIEVMVAMALTAILVLALSGTWAMVADEFSRLVLKQKAVFVLNGEMERLVAYLRYTTTLGADWYTGPDDNERYIYDSGTSDATLQQIVKQNADMTDTATFKDAMIDHTGTQNVVWIDRERNVTGKIWWKLEPVGDAAKTCQWSGTNPSGDTRCQLLTIYLQYPFRYLAADTPTAEEMGDPITLPLQTIVGGLVP